MTNGETQRIWVIIAAAGRSSRFGDRDKLNEDLGGRPVLRRSVELFNTRDDVAGVVVAGPHDRFDAFQLRHGDWIALLGATLCRGGKTHRWETVAAALEHVPRDATHVAVHDAARPATSAALIDRLFAAARSAHAVVPGVAISDTLKRVGAAPNDLAEADPLDAILGDAGKPKTDARQVMETVPREELVRVQTPQVFESGLLRRAYEQDGLESTDDAQLVERVGEPVHVVEGDERNVKITTPKDLELVRNILNLKPSKERPSHKRF
jgi:2-C-methyl-D-erythritol 4-phosphate cytidylyltransferase